MVYLYVIFEVALTVITACYAIDLYWKIRGFFKKKRYY